MPGIADLFIPWLILKRSGTLQPPAAGVLQVIGILLILTGLAILVWVCQAFVRYGHGTPAPFDPPQQFVSRGLYRWVRNPMYLGAAVLIPFGVAFLFSSLWLVLYAVLIILVLHLYIVFHEEPILKKRFGDPYQNYLNTVLRWIPRLPRK